MSQVAVIQQGPVLAMSSREIAALVESRHDNVKRTIERLGEKGVIRLTPSEETSHAGAGARPVSVYLVDKRDSFVVVAQLSPEFTARLVDRWQELESQLAHGVPAVPTNLADALRLAADQVEKNQALQLVISEQAPKVQALERLSGAAGTMCITDAAKHLKINPARLFDWLQQNRWIYRRSGSARWIGYQPRIQDGWIMHKVTVLGRDDQGDERAASQVRITAKGLSVLARKIEEGKL
ncbi:phage antirepressor KilAC domain-containing protein [Pseudomonas aeruginosa]|uniref:phage antirepressor KilAC domain-containing protein n=1 Tax=Pseudomonas aeruginosa TaxID=287 RepID=UPI003007D512